MATRKTAEELLAALGESLGIGSIELDEDDNCGLTIDGSIDVVLEYDEAAGHFTLVTTPGTVPDEGRDAMLAELLNANLLWQGTGGATLGVDTTTSAVVMSYRRAVAGLDAESLQSWISDFVEAADHWRNAIRNPQVFAHDDTPPAEPAGLTRV